MQAEDVLSAYREDYFETVAALSYGDLESRQDGFHASLAFGAAGIAYACWYAGRVLGDGELLDEAERWVRSAMGHRRRRLAFLVPFSELRRRPPSHFLYGRAGLSFVRVLVAHARGDRRARGLARSQFAALARPSKQGRPDLYNGAAGCLAGTAILFQETADPRLRDLGEELSQDLISRAAPSEEGPVLWPELQGLGLSHGSSGACLALLLWATASGSALPAWLPASVESLLASAVGDSTKLCPSEAYHSSLCNGFSGLALLGAKAYQLLGGAALLEAAVGAARRALANLTDQPDLCCGRAGVAFACLALARVDPGGDWRWHARRLALSTLLCEREDWWSAGLYGGEAAIPCLALNLTAGIDAGPPCLDLVDPQGQPPAPSSSAVSSRDSRSRRGVE